MGLECMVSIGSENRDITLLISLIDKSLKSNIFFTFLNKAPLGSIEHEIGLDNAMYQVLDACQLVLIDGGAIDPPPSGGQRAEDRVPRVGDVNTGHGG